VNRIAAVLEKVGTGFLAEAIAVHCSSCRADGRGRAADAFALYAATG
jgi:hypothetical protein